MILEDNCEKSLMRQIRTLINWSLLLLDISCVAMESDDIDVQNGAADPDRSGSDVRSPAITSLIKGKLFYSLS